MNAAQREREERICREFNDKQQFAFERGGFGAEGKKLRMAGKPLPPRYFWKAEQVFKARTVEGQRLRAKRVPGIRIQYGPHGYY